MSVPEIRWGDEEGNYWGIGHQNKSAFAAWARREAVEDYGFSEMDEEVQGLHACRVFYAYYCVHDESITGIWA